MVWVATRQLTNTEKEKEMHSIKGRAHIVYWKAGRRWTHLSQEDETDRWAQKSPQCKGQSTVWSPRKEVNPGQPHQGCCGVSSVLGPLLYTKHSEKPTWQQHTLVGCKAPWVVASGQQLPVADVEMESECSLYGRQWDQSGHQHSLASTTLRGVSGWPHLCTWAI